jgi:8-amino-7-oxononanoate synthase
MNPMRTRSTEVGSPQRSITWKSTPGAEKPVQQVTNGAGASRLVTGNHPLYDALESRLARLKGTPAACVFGSGYLANTGIIPALAGSGDLVLIDELAHACLWAGARLSGATVVPYRHNDLDDLRALLNECRTRHGKMRQDQQVQEWAGVQRSG